MPWRDAGEHVIVTEQRGIGSSKTGSPDRWHEAVTARIRKITKRTVVVRAHPKTRLLQDIAAKQPPLIEQLQGAHALVTWNSAAAIVALVHGVPVFYEAPHFTCEGACKHGVAEIENPALGDRLPAFERMAWGQWSRSEIESGAAFRHLLAMP